ncbi:MAG: hypothetical protein KHZ72_09250 [Lachnospiraceae bacterium]|nr:hypothetical protein [Lachnospiraceae bacterium]
MANLPKEIEMKNKYNGNMVKSRNKYRKKLGNMLYCDGISFLFYKKE